MNNKVTLNGKEYEVSPLRCKHLKALSRIIKERGQQFGYQELEGFIPFVVDSIKVKNENFTAEELEEATMQEFLDAWNTIIGISGIRLLNSGEKRPTVSTGDSSTDDSAIPSAGHIQ